MATITLVVLTENTHGKNVNDTYTSIPNGRNYTQMSTIENINNVTTSATENTTITTLEGGY